MQKKLDLSRDEGVKVDKAPPPLPSEGKTGGNHSWQPWCQLQDGMRAMDRRSGCLLAPVCSLLWSVVPLLPPSQAYPSPWRTGATGVATRESGRGAVSWTPCQDLLGFRQRLSKRPGKEIQTHCKWPLHTPRITLSNVHRFFFFSSTRD